MKKIIALALALVLSLSMATVAFAAATVVVKNEVPGEKFEFSINEFTTSSAVALDSDYFTDEYFSAKVEYAKGKELVESAKFDGDGNFVITLKKAYLEAPKLNNFEIKAITLTGKKNVDTTLAYRGQKYELDAANKIAVKIGYAKATPTTLVAGTDEIISVANNAGTVVNFDGADYTNAIITVGDFRIEGRVYKSEKFLFDYTTKVDVDLAKANPDATLGFYNFAKAPSFTANMAVELESDVEPNDKDELFIYELKDGKLLNSNLKWNKDTFIFEGKVKTLGNYVVSDMELKAAPATDDTKNPNTGANDFVGVAVALAVVSLVAAGAVSLKK